ncbi:MAG TPA: DUF1684 domain-containing protein [Blastocatellia bacterium]|nr:DUF1684 domain-containing protein [Blastocatellia bacterium]
MTTKDKRKPGALALVLMMALATAAFAADQRSYAARIKQWRAERDAELKADDGWLTLAGLFWLKEGDNRIGSDATGDIILPEGAAPARLGVIEFHNGKATLRVTAASPVTLNGKPITTIELQSDEHQKPDVLRLGGLSFHVIKRGARYGVRVKDLNSAARRAFSGRRWYPANLRYRVMARFVAYDKPQPMDIINKLGDQIKMMSPGYVVFKLNGNTYRLDALDEEGKLFFVFADRTNGRTTYGAGRFLYAEAAKDGKTVLDFNQAINPPCAFTPFATCPLPPRQNRFKIAIPAGELNYHHAEEAPAR